MRLPDNIDIQALFADCDIDFNDTVIFPKERSAEFKEWQEREVERRKKQAETVKAYRHKYPEKMRAYRRELYYNETPEQKILRKARVERYQNKINRVKSKATNLEMYKATREHENAIRRQWYAALSDERKEILRAKCREQKKKWQVEHRAEYLERERVRSRLRRAKKRAEKAAQQTENKDT